MTYNSPEFWEDYEERAAILEYDAPDWYKTRQEAEKAAFEQCVEKTKPQSLTATQ